jgi:hypothetical protein
MFTRVWIIDCGGIHYVLGDGTWRVLKVVGVQ